MANDLETQELQGGATTTELGEGAAAIDVVNGVMIITMPSAENQDSQPPQQS